MAGETVTITCTYCSRGVVTVELQTNADGSYTFNAPDAVIGSIDAATSNPASTGENQTVGSGGFSERIDNAPQTVSVNFGYHKANITQSGLTIGFWPNSTDTCLATSTFQSWLRAASAKTMANSCRLSSTVPYSMCTHRLSTVVCSSTLTLSPLSAARWGMTKAMIDQWNAHGLGSSELEFPRLSDIINAASKELALHDLTVVASADRTYQQALKNTFNAINNNQRIFNSYQRSLRANALSLVVWWLVCLGEPAADRISYWSGTLI